MIKTILYATDLGLYGPYIMQHVLHLANTHNADIVVAHAVEPLGVFAKSVIETYVTDEMLDELNDSGLDDVMLAIRERVLDAFQDEILDNKADPECISQVCVVRGQAAEVILATAKQVGADLIVIGSHSGQTEAPAILGSVAFKVLQLAEIPVYMVPMAKSHINQPGSQQIKH